MGSRNPLKRLEKGAKTGMKSFEQDTLQGTAFRDVLSASTMGAVEGGREREARKQAEAAAGEQEALLAQQKADEAARLKEAEERMLKSRQGRRSLLSAQSGGNIIK